MQARAAINGGAIVAASGSAQLPRNGFKKKKQSPWTLALKCRKTMSGCRVKKNGSRRGGLGIFFGSKFLKTIYGLSQQIDPFQKNYETELRR
jgi:hypothetical protein